MGIPKPTEMTIRNFLLKELEKRGVKVNTEISYTTPIGRLMPDMLLHNGAQYVVETKLGAEAKLLDAMVRLYDYSKYTQTKGAFAVLFPKELRQTWAIEILEKIAKDPKLEYVATAIFKDLRPSQRFAGNLSEMADWMASQVLRPLVVEADTSFAVKVLTEAVTSITASVKRLKGKEIEDIFGGKTVFENILQYEEGRYPLEEMRQAATYLLVNQIIFYHVLSRMDTTFEAIDEDKIGKPNDLLRYFRPVLERDYSSVFGFDVASRLPESATKTVKRVIMTIKALAPEKIGQDVLGKVFHELIPFNIRKAVAAFYTNNEAAEILAQLAIDKPDAKVIDLAVGSGTLLVAAYRRKRELLRISRGGISLEDHKKFLEHDLTGVDIMPFAAHLAVMHLSLQALLHETEKVRVAVWDSTELRPDMNIPAIHTELKAAYRRPTLDMFKEGAITPREAYVKKGAITLEGVGGEEIPLEKADLVIMNPPFTRQIRLPTDYKNALTNRLKDYEEYLHGQLGLYGYFTFLADKFTKEGGRIALVLPATVLRVKSARGVRKLLTENYQIEHIITTWQRAAFSESAQFREILLVARKEKKIGNKDKGDNDAHQCIVTVLKRLPASLEEAKEIATKIKAVAISRSETYEDANLTSFKVTQRQLEALSDNLFTLISLGTPSLIDFWMKISAKKTKLEIFDNYLKEVKGEIKRGIETARGGRVQFLTILTDENMAIKKSDVWIVTKVDKNSLIARHRFLNREMQIPLKSVHRALRRVSGVRRMDISDKLDYVISGKFPELKDVLQLSIGKTDTKFMEKWKKYVKERLGNFVVVRRMDISASGSSFLAFYSSVPEAPPGITWLVKTPSEDDAKILAMWFNSSVNILQTLINRKETRGAFLQVDKYTLKEFQILDPRKLSEVEKKLLLSTFEKQKMDFPSILDQLKMKFSARIKIDKAVLKVLGFGDNEIDRILGYLYPVLTNEIEQLKTLMAG